MLARGLRSVSRVAASHPRSLAVEPARALASHAPSHSMTPEEMERKYLVPTYTGNGVRTAEGILITHGDGCTLVDSQGRKYLDFAAGIAVNALGHSDPAWAAVVADQAKTLTHVSNLFHTSPPLELAKLLVDHSSFDKVFLCNSGTEANEAALKFARKFHLHEGMKQQSKSDSPAAFTDFACATVGPGQCRTKGGYCDCWPQKAQATPHRSKMIGFQKAFHGRSMGALSLTHKPAIRQPFAPHVADSVFLPYNDLDALKAAVDKETAAVIVEPIQGEGGIYPAKPDFLRGIREACDAVGALMIVDEIQCGLGRAGRLWAHEAYAVKPDMMTLAKPLAGGLPIGAVLVSDKVAAAIRPGDHGTTFGGNPFVCAAAKHVVERIADPHFLAGVRSKGKLLKEQALELQTRFPTQIKAVRAPLDDGLFVAVEFFGPVKPVIARAAARGLLIISAGENTLRLCPPLIISEDEILHAMNTLSKCIQ